MQNTQCCTHTHTRFIFIQISLALNKYYMSFIYHYSAWSQTVKMSWRCLSSGNVYTHLSYLLHTSVVTQNTRESDRLESIIMMKLGWNTIVSVSFVIQQRSRKCVFCSSFYLFCNFASISFIWSQGAMDKTNNLKSQMCNTRKQIPTKIPKWTQLVGLKFGSQYKMAFWRCQVGWKWGSSTPCEPNVSFHSKDSFGKCGATVHESIPAALQSIRVKEPHQSLRW